MKKWTGNRKVSKSAKRYWQLAAGILVLACSAAAQSTVSMTLTGVGDGQTLGDVYVDPYTATVNGIANTTVICDDWSNNSYLDESWTATLLSVPSIGSSSPGTPMFYNGSNQGLYNELAWLGSQLLANPTNPTTQTEVSFAIWDLTYGVNGTTEESPAPLTFLADNLQGGVTNSEYTATTTLISEAAGETGYNAAGWEVLTPVSGTSIPLADGIPQEFLVYTPEPSGAMLLGVDMLGVAFLAFFFRRWLLRQPN